MVKNEPIYAGDVRDSDSIPGQEDPLEEGMATYSSILDWRIQGAWWATVHRVPRVGHASPAKTEKGRSR